MIIPNKMDGVPGLTQDAVQPGESFTYEFIANDPGTYWYHSHQHSSEQVDRGLYGSLVIDRKSTRLNSSHVSISYAVFCLKKKIYKTAIISSKKTLAKATCGSSTN